MYSHQNALYKLGNTNTQDMLDALLNELNIDMLKKKTCENIKKYQNELAKTMDNMLKSTNTDSYNSNKDKWNETYIKYVKEIRKEKFIDIIRKYPIKFDFDESDLINPIKDLNDFLKNNVDPSLFLSSFILPPLPSVNPKGKNVDDKVPNHLKELGEKAMNKKEPSSNGLFKGLSKAIGNRYAMV